MTNVKGFIGIDPESGGYSSNLAMRVNHLQLDNVNLTRPDPLFAS